MRKQKEFADFLILTLKKLEQKYQATVIFHDVTQAFFRNPFFQKGLMPYGLHDNSFCAQAKRNDQCLKTCSLGKVRIANKCQKRKRYFYGTCYLGLEELIFPIFFHDKLLAFLCVGEFCTDEEKSLRILQESCIKNGLDYNIMKQKRDQVIVPLSPEQKQELIQDFRLLSASFSYAYSLYDNVLTGESYYNPIVNATIYFIQQHFNQDLSLETLASNCFCSPSYLSRLFHKSTNSTIIDYINSVRIERAIHLMNISRLPLSEIAFEVGYRNFSHFSTVFKKITQRSPSEYLLENKGKKSEITTEEFQNPKEVKHRKGKGQK